jgi:hypothetical protein
VIVARDVDLACEDDREAADDVAHLGEHFVGAKAQTSPKRRTGSISAPSSTGNMWSYLVSIIDAVGADI